MLVRNETSQQQLQTLQRQISELQSQLRREDKPCPAMARKCRLERIQHRLGRVCIAPGITLTTQPGSLYATLLKVLAQRGMLARHNQIFKMFLEKRTAEAARNLLRRIGVPRLELDRQVRADEEYQDHCDARTLEYKNKAATPWSKAGRRSRAWRGKAPWPPRRSRRGCSAKKLKIEL